MHRKITIKALTLVFLLVSIATFANDDKKSKGKETHQTEKTKEQREKEVEEYIYYFIQFYNHNDVINHPKWMESILITPSLHKVHHGINAEYHNKNCGGTFSIWDRIYGTHQQELKEVPVKLGLIRPFSSGSPISINLLPFTKKNRPKVPLNNNPILNIGSFLLYIQLLGFIAVQHKVSLIQGSIFATFIFLGTLIIGFIQEGRRGGKVLWVFNMISFEVT